jgi:uncharacterized protein
MTAIRIEKEASGKRGRYVARIDGIEGEAELVFTVQGEGLVRADHTEAPLAMRGRAPLRVGHTTRQA